MTFWFFLAPEEKHSASWLTLHVPHTHTFEAHGLLTLKMIDIWMQALTRWLNRQNSQAWAPEFSSQHPVSIRRRRMCCEALGLVSTSPHFLSLYLTWLYSLHFPRLTLHHPQMHILPLEHRVTHSLYVMKSTLEIPLCLWISQECRLCVCTFNCL